MNKAFFKMLCIIPYLRVTVTLFTRYLMSLKEESEIHTEWNKEIVN